MVIARMNEVHSIGLWKMTLKDGVNKLRRFIVCTQKKF